MSVIKAARTLATGYAYRATGSDRLASTLIDRSAAIDEDTATIAKMMLTREKAVPLLADAVSDGRTDLVEVLVSIGTEDARQALVVQADHADPQVAEAAAAGLALIERARE